MRANPPWLFCFLASPAGIFYWGVNALLVPYLLRAHGVPVERIAGVIAFASIPNVWAFVSSPLIDLGLSRGTWVLLTAAVAAFCAAGAALASGGSLTLLTALLFAGNIAQNMTNSSAGALMADVRPEFRGRAAGWFQTGNIGVGSLAGGALIWLAGRIGLAPLALICALVTFLPALAARRIVESPRTRLALRPLFAELFRNVAAILWSRRALAGLCFFTSPVGVGAVGNLISSVGPDYGASSTLVAWITGAAGASLMGLGSLIGGNLCDRMGRMRAYAAFGLLGSACAAWLWLGPTTPFTYGAGYAAYAFTTGLAYAAYAGLILDVLGQGQRAAATGYALFSSAGNIPLIYMTWLDGLGYSRAGARGLMATDALVSAVVSLILLIASPRLARHLAGSTARPAGPSNQTGGPPPPQDTSTATRPRSPRL